MPLTWEADGFLADATAAYTDLVKEADESSHVVLAGVLLGLAGSAVLSAIALGTQFMASLWPNGPRTP